MTMKKWRRAKPVLYPRRPWWHEIIGRGALAVIGLALLWGGYKCVRTGLAIQKDFNDRNASRLHHTRSGGGSLAPFALGAVLVIAGAPGLTAALVPVGVMEKLLGRQTNNTLWQNSEAPGTMSGWDAFI